MSIASTVLFGMSYVGAYLYLANQSKAVATFVTVPMCKDKIYTYFWHNLLYKDLKKQI